MKLCRHCKKVGKCGKPYSVNSNYAERCCDFEEKMSTNYDIIKDMSVEEMASMLAYCVIGAVLNTADKKEIVLYKDFDDLSMEYKRFLESEVTNDP